MDGDHHRPNDLDNERTLGHHQPDGRPPSSLRRAPPATSAAVTAAASTRAARPRTTRSAAVPTPFAVRASDSLGNTGPTATLATGPSTPPARRSRSRTGLPARSRPARPASSSPRQPVTSPGSSARSTRPRAHDLHLAGQLCGRRWPPTFYVQVWTRSATPAPPTRAAGQLTRESPQRVDHKRSSEPH